MKSRREHRLVPASPSGTRRRFFTTAYCLLSFLAGAGLVWTGRFHLYPDAEARLVETPTQGLSRSPYWHPVAPAHGRNWGNLEQQLLQLYRPDNAFTVETNAPVFNWFFRADSPAQVQQWLAEAGLGLDTEPTLHDTNRWTPAGSGYVLHPSPELVERMPMEQRATLYRQLGRYPENVLQHVPVRLTEPAFADLLTSRTWPGASSAKLRKLAYPDRGTMSFADTPLLTWGRSPDEALKFQRELWRIPAVLLRMRVAPGQDINPLVRYWGPGNHERVVRPLLSSLAALPQGGTISLSDLLPHFARQRFLRFTSTKPALAAHEDCYWSAMNFWNQSPDPQFGEWRNTEQVLRSRYHPVTRPEWSFGDVLLVAEGQQTIHMCVYIAADVVYTKNGPNVWQPWICMSLQDVLALYPPETRRVVLGYRLNEHGSGAR